MFNLRGEPVLFVRDGFDMVPYSPRHQERLSQCVIGETQSSQQCTELECQLRKEVNLIPSFMLIKRTRNEVVKNRTKQYVWRVMDVLCPENGHIFITVKGHLHCRSNDIILCNFSAVAVVGNGYHGNKWMVFTSFLVTKFTLTKEFE